MSSLEDELKELDVNYVSYSTYTLRKMLLQVGMTDRRNVKRVINLRASIQSHKDSISFLRGVIEKRNHISVESGSSFGTDGDPVYVQLNSDVPVAVQLEQCHQMLTDAFLYKAFTLLPEEQHETFLKDFIKSLQRKLVVLQRTRVIRTESGVADATQMQGAISTLQTDENFKETAGVEIEKISAGKSSNTQQGQRNILDMSDFLSRPVEILTAGLALATDLDFRISVWDLFSQIPSVRAKMRNFAYLRGNLHVRISVSGTPFHYGRLLVSYQPYADYNQNIISHEANISGSVLFRPLFLSYLSQAPGSSLINVNGNDPLEIVLPFISTKPMHRLFNNSSTALGAGSSMTDFEDTGDLFISSLNQIKCVSTTPSTVFMTVYAWMEDVELGTNTASQMVITTESGTDERKTGPVERFSSSMVSISDHLSMIPLISPFAKASSIVFGALSGVASLFGWSKPTIDEMPLRTRPEPYTNGAMTIGYDMGHRIVLDPKQELTVDTRVCGVSEDELVISCLAGKPSYYQTFSWTASEEAVTTPIWVTSVHPNLGIYHGVSPNMWNQPTAMAFAVQPFAYWRGDIVFRFEVVCSSFHRGKLGIYYEPNSSQQSLITAATSLNKQFIKVVDIQETQVFEIEVKWAQYRPWLLVGGAIDLQIWSNPSLVASGAGFTNGFLAVFPFTNLQSPDDSDIQINVYAYASTMQVNGLNDANIPTSRLIFTESGTCEQPVEVSRVTLNDSSATEQGLCDEYFGEQPLSFRSLLKRYVANVAFNTVAVTSGTSLQINDQIFPHNQLPYNATALTIHGDIFSYLRYAFLGIRGGIRFRIRVNTINNMPNLNWIKVGLAQPASTFITPGSSSSNLTNGATMNGITTFVPSTNAGIEFELPYYASNLFQICFSDTYDDNGALSENMAAYWYRNMFMKMDVSNSSQPVCPVLIERASGEDFSLLRYQGAPFYVSGFAS